MSTYDKIIEASPALKRGVVWCRHCGSSQKVNVVASLQNGWPKHCGYTMTIDSPEERSKINE